jgi:hypothetical protein
VSRAGVTSKDNGYDALRKRVFGFGRPQIATGILEAQGAEAKMPAPGAAESDEALTLIDVADWMEFGFTIVHPNGSEEEVPARSFIRAWFDQAEPEMREDLRKLMRGVIAGTHTKEQVLNLLGLKAVGGIQKRIADGIDPPNAPSTIARKGSSKPLIASGQLRSGVSFAIRER